MKIKKILTSYTESCFVLNPPKIIRWNDYKVSTCNDLINTTKIFVFNHKALIQTVSVKADRKSCLWRDTRQEAPRSLAHLDSQTGCCGVCRVQQHHRGLKHSQRTHTYYDQHIWRYFWRYPLLKSKFLRLIKQDHKNEYSQIKLEHKKYNGAAIK